MTRLQTEALLLRSVEFSESDRIVHLLTPERGRLTAIAKGARRSIKRFGGSLDLFNHLRVQIDKRRGMARLEGAVLIDPFLPLRAVPGRFALASYLVELLDRVAPEAGAPSDLRRVFGFALAALRALSEADVTPGLRALLELQTLDVLGLRPELGRCVHCGRAPVGPGPVAFHVADGGVLCGACASRCDAPLLRVHLGTLRALEQGIEFGTARLSRISWSPQALAEALELVSRFQRFHMGIQLRSEPFLDQMVGSPPESGRPPA